jgi:GntR family transcriptional regulator
MRHIRYQEIADVLRQRALDSPAGSVLPSEAEMSAEFGASRVTIRRALELVREDGLIAARQGFGWFVATDPVPQNLGSLATIESHVEGVGKLSERKVEEFVYECAPERVHRVLGVDQVLRVKRVNLADGEPFAVVTVWCPAELGAHLSRQDVERRPFYELLDVELRGATQTIGADLVDAQRDRPCCGVSASPPTPRDERC